MTPGKIIKHIRQAKGLPQYKVAKALGITRPYLSMVETGANQPGLGLLKKAAKVFDVPLILFFMDDESMKVKPFDKLRKLLLETLKGKLGI